MEKCFSLKLGTFADQMDLFLRSGLPSIEKNRFFFSNGLFVITNGVSRKIMEFSSYGDLLRLFYHPDITSAPFFPQTNTQEARNQRAYPYDFNHVGEIAVNSQNILYVEDKVPLERRSFDNELNVELQSVVLRFASDGNLIDYIGKDGVGGTPFPAIDKISVASNDEMTIVGRTGGGDWVIWWFSNEGNLLEQVILPFDELPLPQEAPQDLLASIESLVPDRRSRSIQVQIDYFLKDYKTKSADSSIDLFQTRIWTFDAIKKAYTSSFTLPMLPRMQPPGSKEALVGDRPYDFLGLTNAGNHYFLSAADIDGQHLLICNNQGEVLLEKIIQIKNENTFFSQFFVSTQGLLTGMLSDGTKVDLVWWRSDKLQNILPQF